MKENKLKTMIGQGKAAIGSWVSLSDPAIPEMMGVAGYDFAIIDIEHAPLDYQTVENMVRAAEVGNTTPLVRIGQNNENIILRVMESGAYGVVVPHVMDRESARRAVEATKYEPMGIRGISSMTRSARWSTIDFAEHVRTSNAQTMVIPMVEDREGIDNIEEILTTEGVDVVLLGPADLARAYGVTSENDPPVVKEAIERAASVARRVGKPLGCALYHKAYNRSVSQLVEIGVQFITHSTDAAVLMKAWRENLAKARQS